MLFRSIQGHQRTDTVNSIISIQGQPDINIFPLPFNEVLHVQSNRRYTYSIYSMNGALVKNGDESDIDTRTIPSGVYILELKSENDVALRKVVKTN